MLGQAGIGDLVRLVEHQVDQIEAGEPAANAVFRNVGRASNVQMWEAVARSLPLAASAGG